MKVSEPIAYYMSYVCDVDMAEEMEERLVAVEAKLQLVHKLVEDQRDTIERILRRLSGGVLRMQHLRSGSQRGSRGDGREGPGGAGAEGREARESGESGESGESDDCSDGESESDTTGGRSDSSLSPSECLRWHIFTAMDYSLEELTNVVVQLYHGRNVAGFANFISSALLSAELHLLLGTSNSPNASNNSSMADVEAVGAILTKNTPVGRKVVLELHSGLDVLPLIADRYEEMLDDEYLTYAEIASGPLEDELRGLGVENVRDVGLALDWERGLAAY